MGDSSMDNAIRPVAYILGPALVASAMASMLREAGGVSEAHAVDSLRRVRIIPPKQADDPGRLLMFCGNSQAAIALRKQFALVPRPATARIVWLIPQDADDVVVTTTALAIGVQVFISAEDDPATVIQAIASARLGQPFHSERLPAHIAALIAGEKIVFTAEVSNPAHRRRRSQRGITLWKQALTDREREIALLAEDGLKNKEIAERLLISEATVKTHITNILDKLDLGNRRELRRCREQITSHT